MSRNRTKLKGRATFPWLRIPAVRYLYYWRSTTNYFDYERENFQSSKICHRMAIQNRSAVLWRNGPVRTWCSWAFPRLASISQEQFETLQQIFAPLLLFISWSIASSISQDTISLWRCSIRKRLTRCFSESNASKNSRTTRDSILVCSQLRAQLREDGWATSKKILLV